MNIKELIANQLTKSFELIGKEVAGNLAKGEKSDSEKNDDDDEATAAKAKNDSVQKNAEQDKTDKKEKTGDDVSLTVGTLKEALTPVIDGLKTYIDEKLETKEDRIAAKQQTVVESMTELLKEQGVSVDSHEVDIQITEKKKGTVKTSDEDGLKIKLKDGDVKVIKSTGDEDEDDSFEGEYAEVKDIPEDVMKDAKKAMWGELLFSGNQN